MIKLIAQDLEMRFGERLLFRTRQLEFCQGEVIYLQGDNGCGKTTLMKLLAGLLKPSAGTIYTQGFPAAPWWQRDTLLGKAIYLHQHPYLFEGNVSYNLQLAQKYSSLDKTEQHTRMQSAIEHAQLGQLLKTNASTLSGGERQRLALARAWLLKPKLLMLDEPISNMDRASQQTVFAMIAELKQQGTGLLISSHQHSELTALCHQHWHIESQQLTTSANLTLATEELQENNYVAAH
ncbi:ATP-binding cassette domain-containing protein [Shewanella sp. yb_14]|uniref:ABC transporter ATP-binding protein n=1 Tax=unclassified Shewanella TaxID=196818 RepID=UPI00370B409A